MIPEDAHCLVEKSLQCLPTLEKRQLLVGIRAISINAVGPGEPAKSPFSGVSCNTTQFKSYACCSAIPALLQAKRVSL